VSAQGAIPPGAATGAVPPTRHWRPVIVGALRTLATVAVLFAIYFLLPLDHSARATTIIELVVGIAAVVLVVAWQVREISRSSHPNIRATEALAFTATLYLLLFATAYFLMGRAFSSMFTQALTRTDAVYFATTIFTTVGFGDITAKSEAARLVVTAQMLLDLVFLGVAVKVILNAVKQSPQRRTDVGNPIFAAAAGSEPASELGKR
jgi:voltage-gated potassium channel